MVMSIACFSLAEVNENCKRDGRGAIPVSRCCVDDHVQMMSL